MDQQHPLALQVLTAAVAVFALALLCLAATAVALARAAMAMRGDTAKLARDTALLGERLRFIAADIKPHVPAVRTALQTIAQRSMHTVSVVREFGGEAVRSMGRQQTGLAALAATLRLSLEPTIRLGRMLWRLNGTRLL